MTENKQKRGWGWPIFYKNLCQGSYADTKRRMEKRNLQDKFYFCNLFGKCPFGCISANFSIPKATFGETSFKCTFRIQNIGQRLLRVEEIPELMSNYFLQCIPVKSKKHDV